MKTARDIMHNGAECINEDQSLEQAAQMMRDLGVGSLPICGNDNRLQGMITDRDIVIKCLAEGRSPAMMTAGELAQGTPRCVNADADVEQVLRTMSNHQIRRVPVLDNQRMVGMISEADLARHLSDEQIAQFVTSVYATR